MLGPTRLEFSVDFGWVTQSLIGARKLLWVPQVSCGAPFGRHLRAWNNIEAHLSPTMLEHLPTVTRSLTRASVGEYIVGPASVSGAPEVAAVLAWNNVDARSSRTMFSHSLDVTRRRTRSSIGYETVGPTTVEWRSSLGLLVSLSISATHLFFIVFLFSHLLDVTQSATRSFAGDKMVGPIGRRLARLHRPPPRLLARFHQTRLFFLYFLFTEL